MAFLFWFLRLSWKEPFTRMVIDPFLSLSHKMTVDTVVLPFKKRKWRTILVEAATNVQARLMCNIFIHTPIPLFEYLHADICQETTENVIPKTKCLSYRLQNIVKIKCHSIFESWKCNEMQDVRVRLEEHKLVRRSYGCTSRFLNNTC